MHFSSKERRHPMFIGVSEGHDRRYEVIQRSDDYLVRIRDLDTGALEESGSKLFRTAAVAFAYAELSAAFDHYASGRIAGKDVTELKNAALVGFRGVGLGHTTKAATSAPSRALPR